MGLGTVKDNGGATFLSIAGGYIWDRKAEKTDPNYATQEFEKADKTTGTRQGARYGDLTGNVVKVEFRTHQEYGESINVTFDADEERYIISISTNNRYSQDMMKALLKADLDKPIFMKPYDFVGTDKKRAQGISFRQDGEKLDLKVDNVPTKDAEWFKTADKKSIKRFFEDLNDWFVAEVEEVVVPSLKPLEPKAEVEEGTEKPAPKKEVAPKAETPAPAPKEEAPVKEETPAPVGVTPLKMKKELRAYCVENYEGKELPNLDKDQLVTWYNLCITEEELPWGDFGTVSTAEVSEADLESQLDSLLK